MDISALNSQVATEQLQMMAAVKCIKAQQSTMQCAGSIIQDTVEISQEALKLYNAEQQKVEAI